MIVDETLQVRQRRGAVAPRLLELRERKQGVVGVEGEWKFHDHSTIVALRFGGCRRQRTVPVQCVAILGASRCGHGQQRVYECAACRAVALSHQSPRTPEQRIVGGARHPWCRDDVAGRGNGLRSRVGNEEDREQRDNDGETTHEDNRKRRSAVRPRGVRSPNRRASARVR